MTEGLLQKLEEKMMVLLSEVENLRSEVRGLSQENTSLKVEREKFEERIKSLVSLFDAVETQESFASIGDLPVSHGKPVLVQG